MQAEKNQYARPLWKQRGLIFYEGGIRLKVFKHITALVLALVMTAALAVTAYATSVTVDYRAYVYSSQITFDQYDYSKSTTPTVTTMTISATSSLGSGSALYHMKYADGAVAYCIEPGVHSDDSGSYREGSSASWYNLPASVQSGIALAMSLGYPSVDYGTAPGDNNTSTIIKAQKWAATQTVIWELICKYRSAYSYEDWGASPFYNCVSKSRYPTYDLWYDKLTAAMQAATMIPSFSAFTPRWCDTIELKKNAAGSYTATVTDDNEVLGDYNFAANSGSGITFTQRGNKLTITATAAAAKTLTTEKTYSATGSAYEINPDRAVVCWYDRFGRYQALAGYTGVGRDPVKAYIKIKAVEEKGSLTINKVDAETGKSLAGVTYRLYDNAGKKVADAITGADGKAVFKDLPQGKYSYQEIRAPSGYVVDKTKYQITITATALNITQKRTNALAKGIITVRKVDATGAPLAGAELLLGTSADGKTWTEVGRVTTDSTGAAKWEELTLGAKYRITEVKAPAGYTLLTEPLFTGTLDTNNRDITITACNNAGFVLPFTGGAGFTLYFLFAALALMAGVYFCKKSYIKKEKNWT